MVLCSTGWICEHFVNVKQRSPVDDFSSQLPIQYGSLGGAA